jgi:hypothetical protein
MAKTPFALRVWTKLESLSVAGAAFRKIRYPAKKLYARLGLSDNDNWEKRIETVLSSPDNKFIDRVAGAGRVRNGLITMHNGIQIREGSYYGVGMTNLLERNRGVHEPQEERVFAEVLKAIPPKSTMIELGAYWGFYSLWFAKSVQSSSCVLVEPMLSNLEYGRENFALNDRTADFVQAFIGSGARTQFDAIPELTVDQICKDRGISHLSVLHSDIQGQELEMIAGASNMLKHHLVDFIFVSTHGESLHADARLALKSWGYVTLADVTPYHSFADDGLLVMRSPLVAFTLPFEVSQRFLD